jgi:hypothetical protein
LTKHQLQHDQTRLDCFSEPDIVGDKEIDTRHLDGPYHWVKLVTFSLNPTSEWRLELAGVGNRRRTPADRVKERFEMRRLIESPRVGQSHLFDGPSARLQLPDDLQILAESVVLDRSQADEVLWLEGGGEGRHQSAAPHICDDVAPLANDSELTLLRRGGFHLHYAISGGVADGFLGRRIWAGREEKDCDAAF